jgi:hypothetical protein
MARKYFILIATCLLILSLGIVLAFYVTWSATVTVTTTDPNIKVYWDPSCTNLTTSIPFGNVQRGATKAVSLYIKNDGGGAIYVYWNSSLSLLTDQISEFWNRENPSNYLNGTKMYEGQVLQTTYTVDILPTAPLQTYTWTLNVGAW